MMMILNPVDVFRILLLVVVLGLLLKDSSSLASVVGISSFDREIAISYHLTTSIGERFIMGTGMGMGMRREPH